MIQVVLRLVIAIGEMRADVIVMDGGTLQAILLIRLLKNDFRHWIMFFI